METKTFALETIADKENGVLVVKDYEENLKLVTEFLAVYSDIVITNDVGAFVVDNGGTIKGNLNGTTGGYIRVNETLSWL